MSHRYQIFCVTEGAFVPTAGYQQEPPTECPNDVSHIVAGCQIIDSQIPPNITTICFHANTRPCITYSELQEGLYTVATTFPFQGTSVVGTPLSVRVNGYFQGGTVGMVRLFSLVTNTEIAQATLPTVENNSVELTTTGQWSSNADTITLQVSQTGGAIINLYSLTITI